MVVQVGVGRDDGLAVEPVLLLVVFDDYHFSDVVAVVVVDSDDGRQINLLPLEPSLRVEIVEDVLHDVGGLGPHAFDLFAVEAADVFVVVRVDELFKLVVEQRQLKQTTFENSISQKTFIGDPSLNAPA